MTTLWLACGRGDDGHIDVEPVTRVPATKPLEPPPKNVNELDAQRDALMRTIDERAAALDSKISALEKRGDDKAVALLRAKRDQALAKLAELDTIEQDRWSIYERDITTAWDQLEADATAATR